jgi:hypothetical protein
MSKKNKVTDSLKEKTHWTSIRLDCYKQLGFALFYMNYLYPDCKSWINQSKRVIFLCREAAANDKVASLEYWQNMQQRIESECENMC